MKTPVIDSSAFIAPNTTVMGDVTIGARSSVFFGAVIRAEKSPITIGEETNILSYPDAEKISPYAVEALQWAVGEGILNGITYEGDNEIYLAPQGLATRAQAAKLIVTFLYALGE